MNFTEKPAKVIVIFAIALALISGSILLGKTYKAVAVDSFESCQAAGYPVTDDFPAKCVTRRQTFIEEVAIE